MRRATQADIEEMRARGYDPATIAEMESIARRTLEADRLSGKIRKAFAGVRLGAGVGLFEGQALDDYESGEVRRRKRDQDEKESWERIQSKHLNACHSSLCFFDPPGMRFHLPAFLLADLRGEYGMGMEFSLTHLSTHQIHQFSLLTPGQRQVVREYLQFLRADPDAEFHHADIDRALNDYWQESP